MPFASGLRRGRSLRAAAPLLIAALLASSCSRKQETSPEGNPAAAPASASAAADPNAPSRPKIVILGDSLTAGYGLLESQSFPAVLQRKLDAEGYHFEVENAGVSGDTTAGGLRRLDWALQGNARILVVALGGNDGLRGLSVADMQANLTEIITRGRNRGAMVILAGMEAPPNYGSEYAVSFRRVYRDVARQQRVLLMPFLLDGVAGNADLNQADGIHPNERGAEIVADHVWTVLRPVLDQIPTS
jgi:acyl-CoA thioesterase-1